MEIEKLTLFGAFVLGVAHTLEPCEDKAVVSLYALWGSERLKEGILLVVLYGLGMALIDTFIGFAFSFAGVNLFEGFSGARGLLEIIAGATTVAFGLLMLTRHSSVHLVHHHDRTMNANKKSKHFGMLGALLFGLVMGLPPCPIELAIWLWAASIGNVIAGTLTVFTFGLGTTLGLIPLGFVMGGVASIKKKTRYGDLIPKISSFIMILIGTLIIVSSI